jgi:hypothetical protein
MPHRCTIERDRAPYAPDAQRNHVRDYQPVATGVPCRLVTKTQRVPDGVLAESPVITTYTLLLSARQDILAGKVDRIVNVTDHAGNVIEAGPFTVESLIRRTGGTARSHISVALERQGGQA